MAVPARESDDLVLTVRAPAPGIRGVRFVSELFKRGQAPAFTRRGRSRTFELRLARPPGVDRLEYLLELEHANGSTELVCDPDNPLRAPGPFGDKSVLELVGYR